jgi:hypothetical protein
MTIPGARFVEKYTESYDRRKLIRFAYDTPTPR